MKSSQDNKIRTRRSLRCCLCGTEGEQLYVGLADVLLGVPLRWTMKRCGNHECRLLWLDPTPVVEDIPRLYAGYHTHTINRPMPGWMTRLLERLEDSVITAAFGYHDTQIPLVWQWLGRLLAGSATLRERLGEPVLWQHGATRGRILDVGCGSGRVLAKMRRFGWETTGVEPDPAAANIAREQLGLDVRQGNLEEADLPPGSFDLVSLNSVIEHLPYPVATLRRCAELVAPGGVVVVATPNTASFGHCRFGADWRGLEIPRHLHLFNPANIAMAAEQAGLRVEAVTTLIKGAAYILAMSDQMHRVRKSGRQNSTHDYLISRVWQNWPQLILYELRAWKARSADPLCGEELLLVARRD